MSARECHLAAGEVFASAADVLSRLMTGPDGGLAVSRDHVLLHDHAVGSGWNRRAGHDAHAFAGADAAAKPLSGEGGANHGERGRAAGGKVGVAQRVAVHR